MPLFEVAILEEPKDKELEEGKIEKLIIGPSSVVAKDEQNAVVSMILDNPTIKVDRSRMQVLVRPFI